MRKLTLGRKITAGFAISTLLLLMISTISYINIKGLIDTASWIEHTNRVLNGLDAILTDLEDAETGQRGYLITGEDRYLDPYKAALVAIQKDIGEVGKLTSDNQMQQQRLNSLEPLIANKFGELKETIDLRKNKGFDAALQVVLTDKGKKVMDDIRKVVGEMQNEENTLMQTRSHEAEVNSSRTKQTITFGTALSLILLSVAGYFIIRSITKPIHEVIAGLTEGAEQVASASSQVSSASQGLAEGSSQQAAAIEETSSSLEEMASMTKQNAENAAHANQLMTDARSLVEQGAIHDHWYRYPPMRPFLKIDYPRNHPTKHPP